MRQLARNCRRIWYSSLLEEKPALDENGLETLDTEQVWSEPKSLSCCVASMAGEREIQTFGGFCEFSLTASLTGESCPLTVGDRVWVFEPVTGGHDYEVVRAARGLQNHLAALREVHHP